VPRSAATVLAAAVVTLLVGCTAAPKVPETSAPLPTSTMVLPTVYGGCGATQVTAGTSSPPTWALQGFNGSPAPAPAPGPRWAASAPSTVVAILFAVELVAKGIRPDGSSNKILWVTRDPTDHLTIVAHPLNANSPKVAIDYPTTDGNQTPSIVDLPSPGCWSFQLKWGGVQTTRALLDLWVLPAGSVPSRTVSG
jgi:hypothetical protein